ncbi:MAG: hypothetical protein QOD99_891 [Chthoniobacter sp.]|nr:hypothetical protein [Chthoniobacter sp.]
MSKAALIARVGEVIMRLLIATLRIRVHDKSGILERSSERPILWVFWHNRLFLAPHLFERYLGARKGAALTSASKDGELLAEFIKRFGIRPIRGSSSRGGVAALREMIQVSREGFDVAITPDGPRGPRYSLNPGIVRLAQKTGAPLMPTSIEYSRAWRLGRWDGFMIPKPFATVDITLHEYHSVKETDTAEAFEAEREWLEKTMLRLTITR